MFTLCIILSIMAVLVIVAVYIGFFITCIRLKPSDMTEKVIYKKSVYDDYRKRFIKAGEDLNNTPVTPLYIKSRDGLLLHADLIKGDTDKVLIFMHGYRSSPKSDFSVGIDFYKNLGFNIMLIDQRAHGKSDGRYITYGVKEKDDCLLWINEAIRVMGDGCEIVLSGLSMGASTVLFAAGEDLPRNVKAIIADCGFSEPLSQVTYTAKRMCKFIPKIMIGAVNLYCRIFADFDLRDCNSKDILKSCKVPVLFIHGESDVFVPKQNSEISYNACASDKELLIIEKAGHGMSFLIDEKKYTDTLKAFLDKHLL